MTEHQYAGIAVLIFTARIIPEGGAIAVLMIWLAIYALGFFL